MREEKIKFQMRISPETDRKIKTAMPLANCRSQNEFVEDALRFYCDYLTSQDCFSVLPPMLVTALRGRCVQEVKKTHGMISLDDAVTYQNGAN